MGQRWIVHVEEIRYGTVVVDQDHVPDAAKARDWTTLEHLSWSGLEWCCTAVGVSPGVRLNASGRAPSLLNGTPTNATAQRTHPFRIRRSQRTNEHARMLRLRWPRQLIPSGLTNRRVDVAGVAHPTFVRSEMAGIPPIGGLACGGGQLVTIPTMVERHVRIDLPDDLSNTSYAHLVYGIHGLLCVAGVGDQATIWPDAYITDDELNTGYDTASQDNPWAP